MEGKNVAFLFTDTQIVVETMLEDLNNVLNSGEIPNLFPPDEQVKSHLALRATTHNLLSEQVLAHSKQTAQRKITLNCSTRTSK